MPRRPSRREFLGSGLSAFAMGALFRRDMWNARAGCVPSGALTIEKTDPQLPLPLELESVLVDGLPFSKSFFGDYFPNDRIPFHYVTNYFPDGIPPEPTEELNVAVVGGGLSGLATAYFLREHKPCVLELRDRFGGNTQGEVWEGIPYSLGGAYFITPDKGSFLEQFYHELGLDSVVRVSVPPDPVELYGKIRDDFWEGGGLPAEELPAMQRYAEVVTYMADESYPEIPLPDDQKQADWIKWLDQRDFRRDLEERMETPLTPFLHAGVQGYFYSSFGAAMEEISAASGWNFVAAEEFGRWVLPGGNSYFVRELWRRLRRLEHDVPPECSPRYLRAGCRVIDVRPRGANVQVTYYDSRGRIRSLEARQVIMAGSKHITKHVLHDLDHWDPGRRDAMNQIPTYPYIVANVLLNAPILRDFYDVFLVGDETFPADPNQFEATPRATDMIRGDYTNPPHAARGVLTVYFPLPWPSARFTLLLDDPWHTYAKRLAQQVRHMLSLLTIPESAVQQIRITRWGHAMPVAVPGLIASGIVQRASAPLGDNIHFVNQDNWALPAVENSVLDARSVADLVAARL